MNLSFLIYQNPLSFPRDKKSQLIGFSSISLGNITSSIIGGLLWLFLATILQVNDYGEISFFISLGTIAGVISIFGMNIVLLTYFQKEKNESLFNQASSLILISSAIVASIIAIFSWQTDFLVLGIAYLSLSKHKALGLLYYKEYTLISILESLLRLGLSILFFFILGPSGIILGFGISHLALSYRFYQAIKHFSFNFDIIKSKIKFSINAWKFLYEYQ